MRKQIFILSLLAVLTACASTTADNDEPATVDVELTECSSCGATMNVLLSTNFPAQIHTDYRSHVSANSGMARGDLYLRVCEDVVCATEVSRVLVEEDVLLSTGIAQSFTATDVPVGTYYAQVMLDTQFSQEHNAGCEQDDASCASQFDVLQTAATSVSANNADVGDPSLNPAATASLVTVQDGVTLELSVVRLGHIYFPERSVPDADAARPRVIVPVGDSVSRPRVARIDVSMDEPETRSSEPTVDDEGFDGDICGIVPGSDSVYAIGAVEGGHYVFDLDADTLTQSVADPVFIEERDCAPNAIACFPDMTQSTIDVPVLPSPCLGREVARDDETEETFFTREGWRTETGRTEVYRDEPEAPEAPTLVATGEIFTGTCGGHDDQPAGFAMAAFADERHSFVGNDDSISVFDSAHALVGTIDTSDYGVVITDFALSPDGETLYAVPACKSENQGTLSSSTQSQASDRHRIVVLDLTSDTDDDGLPDLAFSTRDFDADDVADGGLDLEFLHLKQEILDWCESCFGVLPPTAITLPRIEASENFVYLRGNNASNNNISGLGQLGDLAVFDISTGRGIIYQNYQPWLDGPSGRWGIGLDSSEASTAGFAVVD